MWTKNQGEALPFCNPDPAKRPGRFRPLAFAAGIALTSTLALLGSGLPAWAQGINILRDTETEEMLRSYEQPLAKAAALNPNATKVWLVGDPAVNAFASFGEDGENIFVFSGILLYAKTPNELIGVMAHETGHIKAGHLIRGEAGMEKAAIPMMLSLVIGLAAMMAGAGGQAGMAAIGLGQAIAQGQFNQFSRIQESTADQIGLQLLKATHQSPIGLYDTMVRFAQEAAQGAYKIDPFAVDHPVGQARVADLQSGVDASPYKDVKDSPAVTHTFEMVQAKLAGFTMPVNAGLAHYPVSNTSDVARYARAMLYLRQPQLTKALAETNSLIAGDPNNPYFQEVLGQIYVSMARPMDAIPAYQKAVNLRPQAPQLRLGLAVAELATDNQAMSQQALLNLKAASLAENDDIFTWYETAQAYSNLKNVPMANLATAESFYSAGAMQQAAVFAQRARRDLPQGTADWERANDILGAAAPQAKQSRGQ
jgi:predicted Zn-dependent protease